MITRKQVNNLREKYWSASETYNYEVGNYSGATARGASYDMSKLNNARKLKDKAYKEYNSALSQLKRK